MASGSTAMLRGLQNHAPSRRISCQASAEHLQQCAEFALLRNRGLGPLAVTVQLEDFETQQRLVTPIPFDVVTRGEEEIRFEFRHSSRSPLVQELAHKTERVDLVIMLAPGKGEQLCLQVR